MTVAAVPELAPESLLVFIGDKSTLADETRRGDAHGWGCYSSGSAFVWADGSTAPLRSKASNRCPGCARVAAYEAMTMLRMDAEENGAPGHVVTLTSRGELTPGAYRQACSLFWRAFRKRWGQVEYCGFVEWTTGTAARSGGVRRLHSHWLVKGLRLNDVGGGLEIRHRKAGSQPSMSSVTSAVGRDPCLCGNVHSCVECWTAAEWSKLTGAWIVQVRELRSVGGVVGYLALHHEKMEQAPPAGWTGRRLRPSKGYFAQDGRTRRERARAWLVERNLGRDGLDDGGKIARSLRGAPRLVGALAEWEKVARAAGSEPGRSFASLPSRVERDRLLRSPDAPIHASWLDALAQDEPEQRRRMAWRAHFARLERVILLREACIRPMGGVEVGITYSGRTRPG